MLAPTGAGKTTISTFARVIHGFDWRDADEARAPSVEMALEPLRRMKAWDEHNRIWHRALFDLMQATNPDLLLCHSDTDARAVGYCSAAALLPSIAVIRKRLIRREGLRVDLSLAETNYEMVRDDALRTGIPIVETGDDPPSDIIFRLVSAIHGLGL